jgi:Asp-tRNA(Asn)/Glu-tRNA(Gln) amidotransferase A subunit family amidase
MPTKTERCRGLDRRRFLAFFAALGLAGTSLPRRLWAAAADGPITKKVLARCEQMAGLEFTDSERQLMLAGLGELREDYAKLRQVTLANSVPPAFRFDPQPEAPPAGPDRGARPWLPPTDKPATTEELAFLPVTRLAALLAGGRVSSVELTRLYLDRLERLDPLLEAVITRTEERALEEAERADRELAAGRRRGALHGIPWGAKDLLAVTGYPTTWGAAPFEGQRLPEEATVVRRLGDAGAVLVAKLTLGALAWGDVWFGGKTKNPWNTEQGSSGSSAGPGAATAAGMVGFAIGSETWGSIVSPATRCGVTGLRPTFGAVSRHGAMALSWTMDKLGPMCRSVEDCALVYDAIRGPDGQDPTVVESAFDWRPGRDPTELRLGYLESEFEEEPEEERAEWHALDLATLETLERLGFELLPIELPDLPVSALSFILSAEAAAAFDELTRDGRDDLLVRQIEEAWPNVFRQARMIPAVEYIQANRVRTLVMREMATLMRRVDAYVSPTFGGDNLLLTNLTGHPQVVLPNGFRSDGTPTSITFTGRLFGEADLLAVAKAYQDATDFHLRRPPLQPASGDGVDDG